MRELNKNQWGIITGLFVAFMHLLWSLAVAFGIGQALLEFVFSLHFLNDPYIVGPFDPIKAVTLLVFTFTVGYVLGYVSTAIWNMVIKKK